MLNVLPTDLIGHYKIEINCIPYLLSCIISKGTPKFSPFASDILHLASCILHPNILAYQLLLTALPLNRNKPNDLPSRLGTDL